VRWCSELLGALILPIFVLAFGCFESSRSRPSDAQQSLSRTRSDAGPRLGPSRAESEPGLNVSSASLGIDSLKEALVPVDCSASGWRGAFRWRVGICTKKTGFWLRFRNRRCERRARCEGYELTLSRDGRVEVEVLGAQVSYQYLVTTANRNQLTAQLNIASLVGAYGSTFGCGASHFDVNVIELGDAGKRALFYYSTYPRCDPRLVFRDAEATIEALLAVDQTWRSR